MAALKNMFSFKSKVFNTSQSKDYFINQCCFGDDTGRWLQERFSAAGFQLDGDIGQEDFGWYFNFSRGPEKYCLVIGFSPNEEEVVEEVAETEQPADNSAPTNCADTDKAAERDGLWLMTIERNVGFLLSLFGQRERGISPDLPGLIHNAIVSQKEITELRWYSQGEFDSGKDGSPEP